MISFWPDRPRIIPSGVTVKINNLQGVQEKAFHFENEITLEI